MGKIVRVDFNTDILQELKEQKPDIWTMYAAKEPKLSQWATGEAKPTVNQLEKIAKKFHIPFGYFFLNELPERESPIPHFRTKEGDTFKPSDNLLETIETLMRRQEWIEDILLDWGEEKLNFASSVTLDTPIEETVDIIRKILNIENGWARDMPTWTNAFRFLRERTEEAKIFTVVNGVVNNNTRRKLDVNEFRGFVLYNDIAPFVFINNNDAISGKIFTIVHEIVHILLGKSASFDLRELQSSDNEIELYCNKCTAEFLVPKADLLKEFDQTGLDYNLLAGIFKVSSIVIARRLLDLGKITKKEFHEFYRDHIAQDYKVQKGNGGNFYNTVPTRLSKRFISIITKAAHRNDILYRDAFKITGLKADTFDKLEIARDMRGR
ncbi:MAG: ImmA/IrrE family metallo-endopeptidase [Bacteroidales bacterium]